MKIKKSVKFLDNVVAELKAQKPTMGVHFSVVEEYNKWLKTLPPNNPAAEYESYLAGNHPLSFPDGWDPTEFGLDATSSVEDYRLAYEKLLQEILPRKGKRK